MNNEHLKKLRHSLAHLLAAAVLEHYPDAKPTIGPATDEGFYYDFDFGNKKITEDDLKKFHKSMKKLLPTWTHFEHSEVSADDARKHFKNNPYKLELIDEIEKEGETITFYTSGTFTDLCRGGHIANPSEEIHVEAFELDRIAGAYWRGNENNTMLTRIYGLAFENKESLEAYKKQREDAKERDHRKLGKELDLFTFSDLVGSGLPLWTPKGTTLRNVLNEKLVAISRVYDMKLVTIPHLAKRALYETSGHAEKFGDELLVVKSHYDEFVMKPVNCPHHTQIYASQPRSYRDLPIRLMESTMQYRDEKPGEISGLTRVRSITVDDGHIFCRPDQIQTEATNIGKIIEHFYSALGLFGNHWVSLSVRDPKKPEGYIGDAEGWEQAESMLKKVSDELGLDARRIEGEAAIYGPKLDYMFKDSLGREWQLATIQIDFAMPKRFGLTYTDEDGNEKTPVMIHRAILGSYERFLAILIEHFKGAFPYWLSPVQVKILPIGEGHHNHADDVAEALRSANVRYEVDSSANTLGKRIRNAKLEKVPFYIILGDTEVSANTVTLESRDDGKVGEMDIPSLIQHLKNQEK